MSTQGTTPGARLPEKGLGLALEILEQVARHDEGSTAADIARAVGAPRATVYRIVNSLVRDEYLVRRADFSGFLLGARVLELAAVVDAHRRPAHAPVVEQLRRETGEAVHLFGFHSAGLTILDEDARHPLSDPATLLGDPTRSAIGHLWLLGHPDRDAPRAPRWRARPSAEDLRAIAGAYTVRGYTEQVAMLSPDRGCLAVPVHNEHSEAIGALTLSTSISRLSVAARHVHALRAGADALAGLEPLRGW
ncbi:IclR family transcriptional regulator [Microbacterium sp. CFBP9034]|uniref:IclR family transcriptional regulator n=1 Tax=Microbacterium sp. CFBP9034 TaxID=3096540 RepID=UPI002A6A410D|nr:helix-turn-helix domain-containing protein [Microbacterium sp. CFBP9034]MDY0910624.1 helix-turn-helix domain-containing protein [Microbacterium sp. CFBP9034]